MLQPKFSLEHKKVFVAGETGLVGRALVKRLDSEPCSLISAAHKDLELTNQAQTYQWLQDHKPDVVIMAAGKVGGIGANDADKAGFLYENLVMAQNVIHGSYRAGVQKLLYLGSSCIYPKEAAQPIKEESLLSGALEPTNEGYALAKIAGLKLCQYYNQQYGANYISAMPTNLYGRFDHFDPEKSHVIPALMLKIYQAKVKGLSDITLWGSGTPLREFLQVDDLAGALITLVERYNAPQPINVGSGQEVSIHDLAHILAGIIGYDGVIEFDGSKPDGTVRKIVDSSKINALGWHAKTPLEEGLKHTYQWFLDNIA